MLKVVISPRKVVYVSFTDDTKPNKGGYFCQIYADPEQQCEIDNFIIENSIVRDAPDPMKRAYVVANSRVKSMFG